MMTTHTGAFTPNDWDAYAQCYDTLTGLGPYQSLIRTIHKKVPQDAQSVLDVGCGTGTLLAALSSTHATAKLMGLDPSHAMLMRAKSKLFGEVLLRHGMLHEVCGQMQQKFEIVTSSNVLYATPDPETFLVQLRSCLKPGGRFVLATPKKDFDNGLILKAHCGDKRPDSFWQQVHSSRDRELFLIKEAFGEGVFADAMSNIAYYNRMIDATRSFHFYTDTQLVDLCTKVGLCVESLELSYADQAQVLTGCVQQVCQ